VASGLEERPVPAGKGNVVRRIAVGQISCESNTFVTFRCDLDTVRETGYILEGTELRELDGTDTEVAGALSVLDADPEVEVVPLLASRWNSSSVLTADAHAALRGGLLGGLRGAGAVDGVFLSCHGTMVAEDSDDPEGQLASAVRAIVGPDVPIAMTLDLHGNVTDEMVRSLDLIVGYEHYPHDDSFTTGQRATRLLLRTVRGEIRPTTARVRLPMIQTAFNASTFGDGAFARLERRARALEQARGVLCVSNFMVGSYVDVPEMGCSTLVITDGDRALAEAEARELAEEYWDGRAELLVDTVSLAEAVERGRRLEGGPIVLLDTADTTGGGAAGDSIDVPAGLVKLGVTEPALTLVVDPEAAAACHAAGVGAELELDIGHRVDPRWGSPARLAGRVRRLSDGTFRYTGGVFGGTQAQMGPSAVFRMGSVDLLVMSRPTYEWADEQYRSVGLDPSAARWVQAKNMMNFRRTYGAVMKAAFVLDLPGPTPPDMRSLPFERARRPWYPLDDMQEPALAVASPG
jgi:microcystin degradation protein MlrC